MSKYLISILAVIAFILILIPLLVVKAQTADQCELVLMSNQPADLTWQAVAGSTPDSNFYFMDKLGDWLKLRLFSFTKDARINTLLDQAQERVGELEVLQKQNNLRPNYVNKIVGSYNNIMSEIDERLIALQSDGKDITDILSRATILSGKNKTIIASILTKSSAQNYQAVQSAYNSTGSSFCEVVDQWVNRENQCNDTILLVQETSNSFNNIVEEIDKINSTKNAIVNSYEQANSYISRVDSINADITRGSINFDASVDSEAKTFSEKDAVLKASLDGFRGDYFYLINNQPEIDSVINDLVAYSIDNSSNFFAKARASSALMDMELNNTEISSDILYIESLMSVNLDDQVAVDDMLANLNSTKTNSFAEEIEKVDSILNDYATELSNLDESKTVCTNLKNDFSDALQSLKNNRLVQAQNKVKAIYDTANNLDSNYLPDCGMQPVIQTFYDILVSGNALNPNNSCSSQSYIDNYIDQIVSWGEGRLPLWDTMLEQHSVYEGELTAKIGTYQIVKDNKQSVKNSVSTDFSNYNNINVDNIASSELSNIDSQIKSLQNDLADLQNSLLRYEQDKNNAYNAWQLALSGSSAVHNTNSNSYINNLKDIYDKALLQYNSVLVMKDDLVNNINNQSNEYNKGIVKAQKLEVVRQELNSFLEDKFSTTVSNYHNSVDALGVLSNEWDGVAEQYSSLSGYIPQLRTAMNGKDANQAHSNITNLVGIASGLQNIEYNAPAYKINNQLDTLTSLYNMRTLGQDRIDNINESVQNTIVNLQSATCPEAQSIYDQGVTDICSNFSVGDYVNTCQVINNLEVQIINTCQTQPNNNCGNGLVDNGEQCDDGNKLSGDGCSSLCQSEITAYCGDGRIQKPNSFGLDEECENMPPNNLDGDGCSSQCLNESVAVCSDGILQQPNDNNFNEQCDDGNKVSGDGCNNLCQIERDTLRMIKINKTIP